MYAYHEKAMHRFHKLLYKSKCILLKKVFLISIFLMRYDAECLLLTDQDIIYLCICLFVYLRGRDRVWEKKRAFSSAGPLLRCPQGPDQADAESQGDNSSLL